MGHCKDIVTLLLVVPLVLSLGLTTSFTNFGEIQEAEAAKAQGVYTKKYGKDTAHIVCGLSLCSDIPNFSIEKRTPNYPITPLQQHQFGVSPDRIICYNGGEVVVKASNMQPACVKPSSVDRLIEIGWAYDETSQAITLVESLRVGVFTHPQA